MHSSLIGKIEKARRYAQERDRVRFSSFKATFRGDNDSYQVEYEGGKFHCTCNFFAGWGECAHTMTLERMFAENLPKPSASEAAKPSATPVGE